MRLFHGPLEAVKTLQLKLVPAPLNATHPLQDKKVMQSVSLVRKDVRRVEDQSRLQAEKLELLQKTGGVVGGHKMRQVEEQLQREKKEKQDLAKRLEQLEREREKEKNDREREQEEIKKRFEQMEKMFATMSPKAQSNVERPEGPDPSEPATILQFRKTPTGDGKPKSSPKSTVGSKAVRPSGAAVKKDASQ